MLFNIYPNPEKKQQTLSKDDHYGEPTFPNTFTLQSIYNFCTKLFLAHLKNNQEKRKSVFNENIYKKIKKDANPFI